MSVINREDAIKAFEAIDEMYPYRIPGKPETYDHYNEGWSDATDKAVQAIEALPDADDGWIPCEDGLPEDGTAVLTTIYIPGRQPKVRSGHFKYGMFMNDNGDVWYEKSKEVLAWMPLPKPYEPKEDK